MGTLAEFLNDSPIQILEEANKDNPNRRMRFKAIIQKADVMNSNGRVYPKAVLESAIQTFVDEQVVRKSAVGAADHPVDGKSKIRDSSHLWEKIYWDPANPSHLIGEAIVLNTKAGQDLAELLRVTKVGISSRGKGDLEEGMWENKPARIVKTGFKQITFDAVIGPSVEGAGVTQITEKEVNAMTVKELLEALSKQEVALDDVKKYSPKVFEALRESVGKELNEDFEKKVLERIKDETDVIEQKVRSEFEQALDEMVESGELDVSDELPEDHPLMELVAGLMEWFVDSGLIEITEGEEDNVKAVLTAKGKGKGNEGTSKVDDATKAKLEDNEKKISNLTETVEGLTETLAKAEIEKTLLERTSGLRFGQAIAESCRKRLDEVEDEDSLDSLIKEETDSLTKLLSMAGGDFAGVGEVLAEEEEDLSDDQARQKRIAGVQ